MSIWSPVKIEMTIERNNSTPVSPLPSARAYFSDLKSTVAGLLTRYTIVTAAILSGALCFLSAVGVGLSALHVWISLHHGAFVAYGAVAGLLVGVGLLLLTTALIILKRPVNLPKPDLRPRAISRAVVAPLLQRAHLALEPADPATQALAVAAGGLLIGSAIRSLLASRSDD